MAHSIATIPCDCMYKISSYFSLDDFLVISEVNRSLQKKFKFNTHVINYVARVYRSEIEEKIKSAFSSKVGKLQTIARVLPFSSQESIVYALQLATKGGKIEICHLLCSYIKFNNTLKAAELLLKIAHIEVYSFIEKQKQSIFEMVLTKAIKLNCSFDQKDSLIKSLRCFLEYEDQTFCAQSFHQAIKNAQKRKVIKTFVKEILKQSPQKSISCNLL